MNLRIYAGALSILVVALAWKAYQLHQERHDSRSRVRWAVAVAIAALTLTVVLDLPRELPGVTYGLDPRLRQLGQNFTLIGTFAALQLLYVKNNSPRRISGRTLVREVLLVVTTVVTMTALTAIIIARNQIMDFTGQDVRQPVVAAFYLVGGAYIVYALASQVVWGLVYATRSRGIRRAALTITAGGALVLLGASASRAVIVVSVLAGIGFSNSVRDTAGQLINIGNPILIIGLSYPVLAGRGAAVRTWWSYRRAHFGLRTLWQIVRKLFPEIIRPPRPVDGPPEPWQTVLSRRRIGFRYIRRLTECRDGYGRVQQYVEDPNGDGPADPRHQRFVEELRACPRINLGVASPDETPAAARSRLADDSAQLVSISRALRKRGTSWCRTEDRAVHRRTPKASGVHE